MVGMTIQQVIPFTIFFMLWVLFFTVCYGTIRIEIKEVDDEYPQVPAVI